MVKNSMITTISDVRLFDGTGAAAQNGMSVVLDGHSIVWVGRREDVSTQA